MSAMRRGPHARRVRRGATLVVAALAIVACSGEGADPVATTTTTTTEPVQPRVDDDVLTIGALIPVNDPTVGLSLTSSFEAAVEAVNEAGGVLGRDVEMLIADEGATPTSAAQSTESLIEDGADAILGPTSSNAAIDALDEAVAAGVVMCSATATAISLDDYPDGDLFFRSVATDTLQATAIAREATSRTTGRVVIVHMDDAFGRPYATAVADVLSTQTSIQVASVAVPFADVDLEDELDEVEAARADTGIILGNGDDIARFLEAIGERDDISFNQIIVNDAARAQSSQPLIAGLDPSFRNSIVGVAPQIVLPESSGADGDSPFASQVIDCINLIALSAAQGESDSPAVIAAQMTSVSSGGDECRTFAGCVGLLEAGQEIDYDGPTRITELARNGDPSRAFFDRFGFRTDGSAVLDSSIAIS